MAHTVCMVHSRQGGRQRQERTCNSTTLKPNDLPTNLCTDIVYCCFGLNLVFNLTFTTDSLDFLQNLPLKTDSTRFWLAVGNDEVSNGKFSVACRDEKSGLMLAMNILSWLKTYNLEGVFLYWTYPSTQESQLHVKLLRLMKELYKLTGKLVGTVVPFEQQLRERFDMPALVNLLAPYSILVTPPISAAQQPSFSRTFTPFKTDFIYKYVRVLWETKDNIIRRDGRHHLCYMTSLAGWSFLMPKQNNKLDSGDMAVGPGGPFPGSNQTGRVSFDDVCKTKFDMKDDTKYGVVAIRGRQFVSYTEPKTYIKLLVELSNATRNGGCFGVWDITWDDYCGVCNLGKFPLTGAMYSALFGSDDER